MEVHVRSPHCDLAPADREYAEIKIGRAVEKILGRQGVRVDVEVSDEASAQHAPHKRVSVHVHLPHARTEVVSVDDADVRAAIDVAADKVTRTIKRAVQRRRDRTRAGSKEMPALQTGAPEPDETAEFEPSPVPG